MPQLIQGRTVYPIGEALANAGVSRSTYFRWVRSGRVPDTQYKDRNGRRLFTAEEVSELTQLAQQLFDLSSQARFRFQHD